MKRLSLPWFLLILLAPLSLCAQSTWYLDLPGNDQGGGDCIQTYDGGVVTLTAYENKVMKLDANGNLLWTFVIDTNALTQLARKIIETDDHGLLLMGTHSNWQATLVWKLDENGNLQCGDGHGCYA